MKCFGIGCLGAAFFALLLVFIVPNYSDYRARAATTEWLALVKDVQRQVEANAGRRNGLVNAGAGIEAPHFSAQALPRVVEVKPSGEILIVGDQVMLVLTPRWNEQSAQKIAWRCVGSPKNAVPAHCR